MYSTELPCGASVGGGFGYNEPIVGAPAAPVRLGVELAKGDRAQKREGPTGYGEFAGNPSEHTSYGRQAALKAASGDHPQNSVTLSAFGMAGGG
jgi:hypothetical protein